MYGGGGGDDETLSRLSHMIMPPLPPLHHHHRRLDPPAADEEFPRRDERVPQWSQQETRDFIGIRAELERDFTVAKRNKTLWEVVAAKMSERGYRRSPDQCKCKWKNLVNRYKDAPKAPALKLVLPKKIEYATPKVPDED
ncbi:hypothetical protein LguiB_028215 [Lonicera macranthoides]